MAPKLLWIGVGVMGKAMCKNLVDKAPLDSPLMIYNRTTQTTLDLVDTLGTAKAEAITSPEALTDAVARADVILTCLANDAAVESVISSILSSSSTASSSLKDKLFIDCSTIHPSTTTSLSNRLTSSGAAFVAAPVFGAAAMAVSGQLIAVLAGPSASVDRARPYFKGVTARAEILMAGEPAGKATTLKIVGNTFVLNMVEQLAEGHVLAEKTGLGTGPLHELVELMFGGPWAAYSRRMVVTGDYHGREGGPAFAVDLARKDAGHAMNLAREAGTRMLNVETGDRHLVKVKEHCGEDGDLAGIYGAVRQEAGLKFESKE